MDHRAISRTGCQRRVFMSVRRPSAMCAKIALPMCSSPRPRGHPRAGPAVTPMRVRLHFTSAPSAPRARTFEDQSVLRQCQTMAYDALVSSEPPSQHVKVAKWLTLCRARLLAGRFAAAPRATPCARTSHNLIDQTHARPPAATRSHSSRLSCRAGHVCASRRSTAALRRHAGITGHRTV